jgi:hypothetical protein
MFRKKLLVLSVILQQTACSFYLSYPPSRYSAVGQPGSCSSWIPPTLDSVGAASMGAMTIASALDTGGTPETRVYGPLVTGLFGLSSAVYIGSLAYGFWAYGSCPTHSEAVGTLPAMGCSADRDCPNDDLCIHGKCTPPHPAFILPKGS